MLVKTSLLLCLFLLGVTLGEREKERKGGKALGGEKEREREGDGGKLRKEQGKGSVPVHNKAHAGSSVSASATGRTDARSGMVNNNNKDNNNNNNKDQAKRGRGHTTDHHKGQARRGGSQVTEQQKVQAKTVARRVGNETVVKSQKRTTKGPRGDAACTAVGGICQRNTYVCQGRYLTEKCAGSPGRQCCMPAAAWDVLCAGHHHNRVRACDRFGCGGFHSDSSGAVHKGVDIVCDDYGNINAPFSGTLGGPVGRRGTDGIQFDGVKLSNPAHCVKIFNIRPLRYTGPVSQGDTLGYLLPLQDRYAGITSHLELQMCDLSDPTPFI